MEIQDYPNYLIYPDGKVFSKISNKFLKTDDSGRYSRVTLHNDNGKERLSVHRIVAIHYIPNPDNLPTVDHININGFDNRLENLRWASLQTQQLNQNKPKNNKSGYKNISFDKSRNKWKYTKRHLKIHKEFDNKIDAICYKFIMNLKYKTFWNTCRITDQ